MSDVKQFRKKPVVIEAWQFVLMKDAAPHPEWLKQAFLDDAIYYQGGAEPCLTIGTLEGDLRASLGDWIIRGVKGEIYPIKDDIFAATYEPASTPAEALPSQMSGAWEWRSRLKGGTWDAWEQGRFGQEIPPFADVQERWTGPALAKPASEPAGGGVRDLTTEVAFGHFKTTTERAQRITVLEAELAGLRAFKAAVYADAGKRPDINKAGEEPVWEVDLFEVERALSAPSLSDSKAKLSDAGSDAEGRG